MSKGFFACWLICVVAGSAAAQSVASGELRGVVSDPSDALVPDARLTVTDTTTALERTVMTDGLGEFRVLLLPPGDYTVTFEKSGFKTIVVQAVRVTVGQTAILDRTLELGVINQTVPVTGSPNLIETHRTQQSNTLEKEAILNLPIDRRDYLTFGLLVPGIVDSTALADNNDLRVKQTPQSGLSFSGSNGRGNSVTLDGGEMNDLGGGVRSTISQEAVQEFQINRSNYQAELGGALGGVINIVSKTGTNDVHGSLFGFFRHAGLDAANPFARVLRNGIMERTEPPMDRQQFGGSLGMPIKQDKTFLFVSAEGLTRNESSVTTLLTDLSIFEPTAAQEAVLGLLPASDATALRAALTSPQSTVDLFTSNSGVFPYITRSGKFSARIDHNLSGGDRLFLRHTFSKAHETNANLQALLGASRGTDAHVLDPTTTGGWTHIFSSNLLNELGLQFGYRGFDMDSAEKLGPEIRIFGFGVFNEDAYLPSRTIERRYHVRDNVSYLRGEHSWKFGGEVLVRGVNSSNEVLFPGRFTFGDLPGALLDPGLPPTFTINALQAYNLGLAQTYTQGFGDPTVSANNPFYAAFAQDSWNIRPDLTLDFGVRYEYDRRAKPLPTDQNNVAPRFGFAWSPFGDQKTVVRGGYGIYYAPTYFQIDWVVRAFNIIDGNRQIAQAFTTILDQGPQASYNVFSTLRAQGVIGTRAIGEGDLAQFGITFPHTGTPPPYTSLFANTPDFASAYSQQMSLGIDRQINPDFSVSVSAAFSRTLRLPRSRDINLLPAAVDPTLGIRVWSDPVNDFVDPLIGQYNNYESTGTGSYSGLIIEMTRRLQGSFMFSANYTYSKAIDDVTDYGVEFQPNDSTNMRAERALSSFDQRHKFVAYGMWSGPAGFQLSPIFRANSGRPFNLLVGYDLNGDRHENSDRPPFAGRNTGIGPNFWTFDMRLAKTFRLPGDNAGIELIAEGFNLLNRLNFSSVNNVVGNIAPPFNLQGRRDVAPTAPLGFSSAFDPRRIQLGARLRF